MGKGPGLYSELGKKARDLLYKDYQTDQKFILTTTSPTGVVISSSGTKKGEVFLADVSTQLKKKNVTTDIKVDTGSNLFTTITVGLAPGLKAILSCKVPHKKSGKLFTTITVDGLAPGLKAILSCNVPDTRSGKVAVLYLHDYAGINASVGLGPNPPVNFSTMIGTDTISLGADVAFDTKSGNFTKCNAGLSYSNADLVGSLAVNDKGDSLKASYYHVVDVDTQVGAEVSHSFSTNENTITVGAQRRMDPLTILKGRINNSGHLSALIQHEWRPRSFLTLSGEVDTKAIEKGAKVGLALALKP